jgi:DNA-directed RNA polymerase specialized sigma24 family protein
LSDSPDGGDDDRYTKDELCVAVSALSRADMARVIAAARHFSKRCGIPHEDLRQEAFCLIFEGRRCCKRATSIVTFIAGVMRSIAGDEHAARKKGHREEQLGEVSDSNAPQPHWHQEAVSPEQAALSRLTDVAVLKEIEDMVADDEELALLVEGICDGMQGKDLQVLLGVDVKGLAAVRKRLKRKLNAKYPERKAS